MPELADIFGLYGAQYLERFGRDMLPSHRRALRDLRDCRTAAMGGILYVCDRCGQEHYAYHSCRNRACPKCHGKDTEAWLDSRRQELLPIPYFHLVLTIPNELRDLVRRHQKTLYPILMRAAAKALIKLADDPHYVGGLVAVMAILHTWSRTLVYHPHVHCLVPAGGLSPTDQLAPGPRQFPRPRQGAVEALPRYLPGSGRQGSAADHHPPLGAQPPLGRLLQAHRTGHRQRAEISRTICPPRSHHQLSHPVY